MNRGFTLPELLIALLLASLVIAAALTSMASASNRFREVEQRSLLQERATFALGVLEPELQMAGFGGLRHLSELPLAAPLPSGALACGVVAPTRLAAIHVGPGYRLACPAHFGGAMEGADVLTTARASSRIAAPEDGRLQVKTSLDRPEQDGVFVGGGASRSASRPGMSELRDLLVTSFYVARRADGPTSGTAPPALRVKDLTAIAGAPTFRDTEVTPGIEDLKLLEGWRADASEPLEFTRPGVRPDSRAVEAVQVYLMTRSDTPVLPARNTRFRYAGHDVRYFDGYVRVLVERRFTVRQVAERS
jgi:type IV pilus assembly protein PilW